MVAVLDVTKLSERGVAMDSVVETVVEVQELSLAELAQVAGGLGDAVFA